MDPRLIGSALLVAAIVPAQTAPWGAPPPTTPTVSQAPGPTALKPYKLDCEMTGAAPDTWVVFVRNEGTGASPDGQVTWKIGGYVSTNHLFSLSPKTGQEVYRFPALGATLQTGLYPCTVLSLK